VHRVTEFNSLADLSGIRPIWDGLLRRTPGATFFHSLDWLETFWQFFGEGNQLRVLLVEDAGGPIGILPLATMREPMRMGQMRVLTFPLAGWGSFYGPIGPRAAETLAAGVQHVRDTRRDWDVFDLRWIDADDVQRFDVPAALDGATFKCESQVWHTSAQVEIAEGWDAYWRSRKSTWRSNVRRCEKLLSRHGTLEHVRYRPSGGENGDGEPRWDLYDTCVALAERSWQGSSTGGTTLSHATVREYLRAAHESAAKCGAVDLNLLLLDGKPIAYAYNYCWDGWVYGVRSGYDASATQDGAGTTLLAKMIEDSCRHGDRLIDLGPNYLENKRYWLTRLQPAFHYTVFNSARLRAQAMRLKRVVKRWLGSATGAENLARPETKQSANRPEEIEASR
jgi:CelD/BcsL family acetyltransferase involved in cellulose biosynthesis